jgi:hypothetical protein
MSTVMTSPIYTFDESEFISRFIRDYYTETNFDLDASFREYFQNFVQSNSSDYNSHVFIELFIADNTGRKRHKAIKDFDNFLYLKLYDIIKTAMKV